MYRVSEDIFFLNISEQVEYLTKSFNKIGEEWDTKGKKWEEDFTKIKEEWATFKETMSSKIDAQDAKIATLEGKIQGLETKFNDYKASNDARLTSDETKIKANETTILEHTNSISAINKNIEKVNNNINDLNNNKQAKVDNNLTTTSKEVVKAINENKANIDTLDNRVESVENGLNLKQNITDNTLETTAKTIVGAINELKNSGGGSGGLTWNDIYPIGSIIFISASTTGGYAYDPNDKFTGTIWEEITINEDPILINKTMHNLVMTMAQAQTKRLLSDDSDTPFLDVDIVQTNSLDAQVWKRIS